MFPILVNLLNIASSNYLYEFSEIFDFVYVDFIQKPNTRI